jgi:hypothetical protein
VNWGLARLACGATGVPIGQGWGIFVSAQDNDLGLDRIVTVPEHPPWVDAPVPSSTEVNLARMIVATLTSQGYLKEGSEVSEQGEGAQESALLPDREAEAVVDAVNIFRLLDEGQQIRVIGYLDHRYGGASR